jgi:hypothetical protein
VGLVIGDQVHLPMLESGAILKSVGRAREPKSRRSESTSMLAPPLVHVQHQAQRCVTPHSMLDPMALCQ